VTRGFAQIRPEVISFLSRSVDRYQIKYLLKETPQLLARSVSSKMAENPDPKAARSILEFHALDIDGNDVALSKYEGYVTYIVNLASQWGLTKKNYAQLAELHASYYERGLRILGFPCNQFGKQEPGTNAEIKEFAIAHGAKFDLFSKIEVNGSNAHPLYKFLKKAQGGTFGDSIKWNFTKFLCNKKGVPVKRYSPTSDPLSAVKDIEAQLDKD